MPYVKIDVADTRFSWWIRLRDRHCMRCHSPVRLNDKGLPISHTNSHYYGRGAFNTRFDPENCDTLCYACHVRWGSTHRNEYEEFKVAQIGQQAFDLLLLASNTYRKRDFPLERLYWRQRLLDDFNVKV